LTKINKNQDINNILEDNTIVQLQSFKLPKENYDDVIIRLLKIASLNSISESTRDKVLKIGQTGDSLDDVINLLAEYYYETTRSYGIRSYLQAREDWKRIKKAIEAEKYNLNSNNKK